VTLKASIWAVMVVPILAPIITGTLCAMDMIPAEIKPTSRTVVTDDDWIIEVMIAPHPGTNEAVTGKSGKKVLHMVASNQLQGPLYIISIPNRNSARPPNRPPHSSRLAKGLLIYVPLFRCIFYYNYWYLGNLGDAFGNGS